MHPTQTTYQRPPAVSSRPAHGGRVRHFPALAAVFCNWTAWSIVMLMEILVIAAVAACAGRADARRGLRAGGEPEPERAPRLVHFGKAWATAYALVLMALLTGCSDLRERQSTLEQKQRESIAEKTTADVVRDSETRPAPTVIRIEGRDGAVTDIKVPAIATTKTTAATSATAASDSAASGTSLQSVKFPLWIALIGGGIGLIVISVGLGMLWKLVNQSRAAKAVAEKADAIVANAIHSIRSEAINAQPGAETARLVTIAADLERDRTNSLKKTHA